MNLDSELTTYFSNRNEVVAAFLFGSHARSRQRPGSDVDVGVLLTFADAGNLRELRTRYTVELGRILKRDVHIVVLNTAGEELLRQVFSKGRCLQVNDPLNYRLFRTAGYSRIADFDQYRRIARRGFIGRLKSEAAGG